MPGENEDGLYQFPAEIPEPAFQDRLVDEVKVQGAASGLEAVAGGAEVVGGLAEGVGAVAEGVGGALEGAGGCLEGCGGCSLAVLLFLGLGAGLAYAM